MQDDKTKTDDILTETTKALEEAFAKEGGSSTVISAHTNDGSINSQIAELTAMENKIKEKAEGLQNNVRTKLESLKSLKTEIEQTLNTIKGLEVKEGNIHAEIEKIKDLEEKRNNLNIEIKNLEEDTAKTLV